MTARAKQVTLTRTIRLPDRVRLERFRKAPELGPKILFFSGGSALNALCRELVAYTHNSIHLITPFDSGGSSAELRRAFRMPAVGDLRNRLMVLADRSVMGNPEVRRLFDFRFPTESDQAQLLGRLREMARGRDRLVASIPEPLRQIVRSHLDFLLQDLPADFDLRGASVGNLILAGGYLNSGRQLDPVIFLFSKLAEVRGIVQPIVNQDLHLVAELADGQTLVGQHLLTGREAPALTSPIRRIYLSRTPTEPKPVRPPVRRKIRRLIAEAELICLPMGSFYSSLLANLLPAGVGQAVAAADAPKVYIPNTGHDAELVSGSVVGCLTEILRVLKEDHPADPPPARLIDFVLLDLSQGRYPGRVDPVELETLGLTVIDAGLVTPESDPHLDPKRLAEVLLSLI